MKRSQFLSNTLKETPKEAVVTSHILMLRACMIKQLTAGIYSYLPLALRSLRKIENIIREELDAVGCQELLMPVVQPGEIWEESKRWQEYGKELLRFTDRKDNDYCLGPTHEEVITDIVRREYRSYKELPVTFYQIQTKFRDEIRPRFGLMRGREFMMKDAYSFDVDAAGCDKSYWVMYEAYKRIFQRCGLTFRPVEADSGAIGGDYTHEFHVLAQSGEDLILSCNQCEYAANSERCELRNPNAMDTRGAHDGEVVNTPGVKSIQALCEFMNVAPHETVKTMLYLADGHPVGAMIPGDRELNEVSLKNAVGAVELTLATDPERFTKQGLTPGFLGPVNWPKDVPLYADPMVTAMTSAVVGGGKPDVHLRDVRPAKYVKADQIVQLRAPQAGDACARCESGNLETFRGIEVGQVFKLGTKYSETMGATFLDGEGKEQVMVMGCYGIGVSRTMAAALEQNHDKDGIIWPVQIAPFHVMLLNLDIENETVNQAVASLYGELWARGIETLVDDTANRPGPKFKDADLLGMPLQVVVGSRGLANGNVEIKDRRQGEKRNVPLAAAVDEILSALKSMGWESAPGKV